MHWSFLREIHALDSLFYHQWVSGEYRYRHWVTRRLRPSVLSAYATTIARHKDLGLQPHARLDKPARMHLWVLPTRKKAEGGARTCLGHTDRPLNLPTKTLKAGGHGVPGGENLMVRSDGSMRYFMFRESASLRTFPEGEGFHG